MVAHKKLRDVNLSGIVRFLILAVFIGWMSLSVSPVQADALTFNPDWGAQMYPGDPWSLTLEASGGQTPYSYQLVSGNVPGISFTNGNPTATYAGMPATPGSYPVSFSVTDSSPTPATVTVNHTFVVAEPLSLSSNWGSQMFVNDTWTNTWTASGGIGAYHYSLVSGNIPGLTFNAATATFSGTPTTSGSYPISIRVQDSASPTAHSVTLNHTYIVMFHTAVSIRLVSAHPTGDYRVGENVWAVIDLNQPQGVMLPISPALNVAISVPSGPACTATLDENGQGECYLRFINSGLLHPQANFNGSTYFAASSAVSEVTLLASDRTNLLSSGRRHTCMLAVDGSVDCWGSNKFYTIQDSMGNILSDISTDTSNTHQISAGGYHTCTIDSEGTLHCWGDSADIINAATIPNSVNGKTVHYIHISSGDDFVCAVDTRHKLHCWGEMPENIVNFIPVFDVRAVSSGSTHVCAIAYPSEAVSCWGSNTTGQLNVPLGLTAKKVAVGTSHSCAIRKSDSQAVCWGTPSINIPFSSAVSEITSGANYSCSLTGSGTVTCAGTNDAVVNATPVEGITALGGGNFHVCAIKSGAGGPFLKCWGDNSSGQSPRLSLTPRSISAYLPLNLAWSQTFTAFGGAEPYLLSAGAGVPGGLSVTGFELSGTPNVVGTFNFTLDLAEHFESGTSPYPLQLASLSQAYSQTVKSPLTAIAIFSRDTNVPVGSPVDVAVRVTKVGGASAPALTGTVTITGTALVSGENVSCTASVTEVSGVGQASCQVFYGESGQSQIISAVYDGDSFYTPSAPATTTTRITPIVINPMITAGNQFSCSINSSGSTACWGKNDSGQAQAPIGTMKQISAGDSHTCALDAGGRINCWGWNGYGLISSRPVAYGYIAIASGEMHSCALYYNNRVDCWGDNSFGQNNRPNISFKTLDAGAKHTCGLAMDGTPRCWGNNNLGQSSAPASAGFLAISAGGDASCGINASGGIQCWGGTAAFRAGVPSGSFLSISVGEGQACAIDATGGMHCWGDQTQANAGSFGMVASGNNHTCALTTPDTFLQCWGENSQGQAPIINVNPTSLPVLQVNQPWSGILTAAGGRSGNYSFSTDGGLPSGLLLTSGGSLQGTPTEGNDYNFGVRIVESDRSPALMQYFQFAQRVKGDSIAQIQSISPANPQTGEAITINLGVVAAANNHFTDPVTGTVQVTVGASQVCQVALVAGSAECTVFFTTPGTKSLVVSYSGDERYLPADSSTSPYALEIIPFVQTSRVVTGDEATYIHRPDGSLGCLGAGCQPTIFSGLYTRFGSGTDLTCGLKLDGNILCRQDGVVSLIDGKFRDLAVGANHYCALDLTGQLQCGGQNDSGQSNPPAGQYLKVFSGNKGSCAIRKSDGLTVCWGNLSLDAAPDLVFDSITIGDSFACGLNGQEISCWGDNAYGRLAAPAGDNFTGITAGDQHACAIDGSGLLQCWGAGDAGQLKVPYGGYAALDAFGNHTCAIRSADEITCWGDNPNAVAPQIVVSPFSSTESVVYDYWEHFFNPEGGVRPYEASVVSGSLPVGITLEDDIALSPAGVVAYGAPTNPALYQFVIRWKDSSSPQLVRDFPYQLMVTGADLEVEIVPAHPTTALKSNRFYFDYVLSNHTPLDIPGARLDITLPTAAAGWEGLQLSGLDDCLIAADNIQCDINSFPALGSLSLRVSGMVNGNVGEQMATSAQIESLNPNWPEIHPIDNVDGISVLIDYKSLITGDNFDDGLFPGWESSRLVSSPSGEAYLESEYPASQTVRLLIDPLAGHKRLVVHFDLFILGDWQGNGEAGVSLPALFEFGLTGATALVHTTFCNLPECKQAYPGRYPGWDYPAFSEAITISDLGYEVPQARYRFDLTFDHTVDVLDLTWLAENLPAGARFGIDNVEILLDSGWRWIHLPMLMR
ncbi:MAG: hypothetical protein BGO78_10870 [Chloroflexi bacterium 44-23]|nr:MAG: hypothetical protein BGO78_10870 [Chloroflexi bacterium 44-23]